MTTLNTYEAAVADLLHDPNNQIWSLTQLDGYINEARRQLVMDTGCLRTLQNSYLTQGLEAYTFGQVSGGIVVTGGTGYSTPTISFSGGGGSGVAATLGVSGGAVNTISFTTYGSGYTSVPGYTITGAGSGASLAFGIVNVNTYDVLNINVIWGNQRYPLRWKAWSEFSAYMRQWTSPSYQRLPAMWAVYGDNQFYVGPTPDQSYAIELDSVILPTPYASGDNTTVDPIPVMVQDPVKFYAAYLAKFNNQAFGEAEMFRSAYDRRLKEVVAAYTRRIPNLYG